MKFDDAPRLSKLPFILGDIALILLAGFIAARHSDPLSPLPLLVITGCVVIGVAVFMIPYIVNDARDKEDAAASLRHELSEQFKRLIAASEHLQHASVQLKSIEEASTKSVESAERLPFRLQEKIAEFNQQLVDAGNKEKAMIEQELARLRSAEGERLSMVAGQIAQTLAEWTKIEAGARQQFAETMEREKESLAQQAATLRSADLERQAAATAQITTALAEWTKIEADARQSLADMMRRGKELFEEQAVTLRSTDRERHTAAAAQIANSLAEWARIEADARLGLASTVQREKELFAQQVGTLRTTENQRLAAAAEEITMTLASWTGIEAVTEKKTIKSAETRRPQGVIEKKTPKSTNGGMGSRAARKRTGRKRRDETSRRQRETTRTANARPRDQPFNVLVDAASRRVVRCRRARHRAARRCTILWASSWRRESRSGGRFILTSRSRCAAVSMRYSHRPRGHQTPQVRADITTHWGRRFERGPWPTASDVPSSERSRVRKFFPR